MVEVEAGGMVRWRVTRDGAIVSVSLMLLTFEVLIGGGRPSILTCLSGLLLTPIALRADEARRRKRDDEEPK